VWTRLEAHAESLLDGVPREPHAHDVRSGRITAVDDEVRVELAHLRAARDRSLETRGLDEPTRAVARRVLEHRAARRKLERLRRLSVREVLGNGGALGVDAFVGHTEPGARHDRVRRQERRAVREVERRRVHALDATVGEQELD
jgi:hypothetical protein